MPELWSHDRGTMTGLHVLQAGADSGPTVADLINFVGIAILFVYGYFHYRAKRTDDDRQEEAEQNAVAAAGTFVLYALLVGMYGHSDTWVGQIGIAVDRYFEEFAHAVVLDSDPAAQGGTFGGLVRGVKTLGLATYIFTVALAALFVEVPVRAVKSVFGSP